MEKEFIEKMKTELLEQRDQILRSLAASNTEFKKLIEGNEPGDEADIASDVIDGKLLETLSSQDSNRLTMIDNALDRIKQGTYGFCLRCHNEIPIARLEAIPYAFMCIACKSADERRNR